jgi:Fe-S oxidoreductase
VSACANCRIQLEEGLEVNNMDIPVISLTETIAEHLAGETSTEARQS